MENVFDMPTPSPEVGSATHADLTDQCEVVAATR